MTGRIVVVALLAFTAIFGVALYYFQVYAWYERASGVGALTVAGEVVPVADYDGIDSTSSPLKLRGCFRSDPAAFAPAGPPPVAEPLTAPFWFDCFDAGRIQADLASGAASAHLLAADQPPGFDLVAAIYPDGQGFVWRQLSDEYRDQ